MGFSGDSGSEGPPLLIGGSSMSGTRKALLIPAVLAAVVAVSNAASGATSPSAPATSNTALTVLTTDVVPGLSGYTNLGPLAPSTQLNVVVTMSHDLGAVSALESSLNDPNSANYENWLTPDQFQAQFDAPATTVA